MIFAALFEFSFFALAFWIFLLLLIVGTAFDRHGKEEPKWYLIGIGFIGLAAYFWPDFTFFGPSTVAAVMEGAKVVTPAHERVVLWNVISSAGFWIPVGSFLGIGLVYSILEFGLTIRKSARGFGAAWQSFLGKIKTVPVYEGDAVKFEMAGDRKVPVTKTITYGELISTAKSQGATYRFYQEAVDLVGQFVSSPRNFAGLEDFFRQNKIISASLVDGDKLAVEPKVNKLELAEHVGAWTFLWPAYAISLIVGDLFTELFITFANFLASISGRVVKAAFKDVFTLKA
jgi:hypothetical protein